MKKATISLIFSGLMAIGSLPAFGALVQFTDKNAYVNAGAILESNDFEMFGNWGAAYPGNPWHIHGVTYANEDFGVQGSTMNYIMGMGTNIYPISRYFGHSYWRDPITASIDQAPQYNMFSFDLAYALFNASINTHSEDVDFTLHTNLNSYSFTESVGSVSFTPTFVGFIAGPGEYFTGFEVKGRGTTYGMIDNVTLGQTAVPSPPAALLFFSGLSGLALYRRRPRRE